jgi:hypothetical protein
MYLCFFNIKMSSDEIVFLRKVLENWVFMQMDRGQQELNLCRVVLLSGTFLLWFHC